MRKVSAKLIEDAVYSLARKAGTRVSRDCERALKEAFEKETSPAAKFALETILKNAAVAESEDMAICQDCGMAVVTVEIGEDAFIEGSLSAAVNAGVTRAYRDGYFRMSTCDPLTRENRGDNLPAALYTELIPGDGVKITYMPKGFGSENMSRMYMLKPAQGTQGILDAIVSAVREAGSRPCPPVVVGVGIGGNFDTCAHLAKKALARDLYSHNERKDVKEIEIEALKRINELHIGCQGFGGDVTALAVLCEVAPTHIAGLPVAVNMQCHCVRKEVAEI